jgi:thioredoxin 1
MLQETNDATFKQDVLDARVPVLVDFWAPWCGPCRIASPIIERVSQKAGDKARIYKINVDNNQDLAIKYGITGIPTVVIFKNGKPEKTFVGVQDEVTYYNALGVN